MILILNVVEKGSCFRFTTQQLDSLLARQAHHECENIKTVSKQFTEAIRVMKLDPHEHVVQHFKNLTKDPETTAEFLKDLKFKSDFPEYQAILGYLSYWSEKH